MKPSASKDDAPDIASHYFSRHSPQAARESATGEASDPINDDVSTANADVAQASRSARRETVRWIEARVRRDEEGVLRLATGAGTFARSGLDAGSALLLQTVRLPDAARVLDLGCGWGALGCFCASFSSGARVWMCDINYGAVLLAQSNARENDLTNVAAWRGDSAQAVRSESFDIVLCNPPIRAGNAVIARLFDDAQRVLKSGGALWIVIRTAQGAKSWQKKLHQQFGNCETVAIEGGYRILQSVK